MIFSSQMWYSKKEDRRREIFDNYGDYIRIDKCYASLAERDAIFIKETIDSEGISRRNAISLGVAKDALEIEWAKYYDGKTEPVKFRKQYSLLFPATILGSLCITYLFEGLPFYFLSQQSPIIPFIISLLGRTVAAYYIVIYITTNLDPTAEEFAYSYRNKNQSGVFLNKRVKTKLFMVCAGIIGLPSFYLVSFFLSYSEELGSPSSLFVYDNLSITILLLDIVRISILLLVAYRIRFEVYGHQP